MSNARDIADAGHQLVAWVLFDGTASGTTWTLANNGIRSAFNVSSVTDQTSSYKINFANSLGDNKMCISGFSNANPTGWGSTVYHTGSDTNGDNIEIKVVNNQISGTGNDDSDYVHVIVYR